MSETSSRWLLEQLTGFATVSRDSNLALIAFVQQYLADLGVASEVFHNDEGTKASLFATIGPDDRGASCCRVIPTWFLSTVRPGQSTRFA